MKKMILPISSFLLFFIGCENRLYDNAINLDSQELQELSRQLSSDLSLAESSRSLLNGSLRKHGAKGKYREPGFLWKLAGDLSINLSDEEKSRLTEKIDEKNIPLFGGKKRKKTSSKNGQEVFRVLSDEQKTSFKSIKALYDEQFKIIKSQVKEGSLSKEDAKSKFHELQKSMREELLALLTDAQKAQIKEKRSDKRDTRIARMDSVKSVMVEVLQMSLDQAQSFEDIQTSSKETIKNLFDQSRNGEIDRETLKASLKSIHTNIENELLGLFSDSQFEIIKIHKALELRMKKRNARKSKMKARAKRGNKG
mgnify:CR=1 FL=1